MYYSFPSRWPPFPHIHNDIGQPDTTMGMWGSWITSWTWYRTRRPCQWRAGWRQLSQRSPTHAKTPQSRVSLSNWPGLRMNCLRDISSSRLCLLDAPALRSFSGVDHSLSLSHRNSTISLISKLSWSRDSSKRNRTEIKIGENWWWALATLCCWCCWWWWWWWWVKTCRPWSVSF